VSSVRGYGRELSEYGIRKLVNQMVLVVHDGTTVVNRD
jgi:hypothetical protein